MPISPAVRMQRRLASQLKETKMSISPATLSAFVAMLSSQGIQTTNQQIATLLAPLEGKPNPDSTDLQPGESYLLENHEDREINEFSSREALDRELKTIIEAHDIGDSYRALDDFVNLWIIRRQVTVESVKTVKVILT